MAKRRSLEAPSSADLQRLEEEFRSQTAAPRAAAVPIAQVAAEAAAGFDPRPAEQRVETARDRADAQSYRDAQGRGLVMLDLSLDEIEADALVRDRTVIDTEELEELKSSIARNGLRLPVEVFLQPEGQGARYGLLSGYRRLMAVRALRDLSQDSKYDRIKAVLREPEAMGGAFAAMIEENEIRSSLSHYERGRIAVIAAQQGSFPNTEAAVDALFPVASKAKRSKIRSFALIFEELGDLLKFPDLIREKDGLRLAQALRDGQEEALRDALAREEPQDPASEAGLIEAIFNKLETPLKDPRKGGRPRRETGPRAELSTGYVLSAENDAKGWMIRIGGQRPVDRELINRVMDELRRLLGQG